MTTQSKNVEYFEIISGRKRGAGACIIRLGLLVLSWIYGMVIGVRNLLYNLHIFKSAKVAVPVISIGNITAGGTGKTHFVQFLATQLKKAGKNIAIVSRGYKADKAGGNVNEEYLLLKENLPDVPHYTAADRFDAATRAIEERHPDVLILDDAFQHRKLARDVDIVLIDATNPFGYGHLLPRGILREPAGSLKRADVVVVTRSNLVTKAELLAIIARVCNHIANDRFFIATQVPRAFVSERGTLMPEEVASKKCLAFCGIGNPYQFRKTLEDMGAKLVDFITFDDHHQYINEDVEFVLNEAKKNSADFVLTTQKDYVKIRKLNNAGNCYYLKIDYELADSDTFNKLIMDKLNVR